MEQVRKSMERQRNREQMKEYGRNSQEKNKVLYIKGRYKHSKKETIGWEKAFPKHKYKNGLISDFSDSTVDKNPPADAGDTGSRLGLGRFHT